VRDGNRQYFPASGYLRAIVTILRKLAGSFWLRALVSAGLLALVLSRIDFGDARERLSGGSWGWFAAAAAAMLASFLVGAFRWHLYLDAAAVEASLSSTVRAYLIGVFTTNFLPSQLGGDVTRTWVASRPGTRLRAATTVVVDRATALACLVAVGWIAVAANPGPVPGEILAALAAANGAVALGAVLVALIHFRRIRIGRPVSTRLLGQRREVREAASACLRGSVLRRTIVIGLGFQGLVALAAWFVLRSIALDLPFSVFAASLAPVLIVSAAPISIAGFGVREGSYVVLLGYAGVSTTDATLLSLVAAAAFAVASLPGAVALLRGPPAAVAPLDTRPGSTTGTT
jgi:glycosyltransferase 2 family protein